MSITKDFYESQQAISEYLLFHYGDVDDLLLEGMGPVEAMGFPRRCADLALRHPVNKGRALDLGCAVGGSACALSAHFAETVGIDFSRCLIDAAQNLLANGAVAIEVAEEGEIRRELVVRVPASIRSDRLQFQRGDAMNLSRSLGAFDFVLMANLLDRLPDPAACLAQLSGFINPGGILAITSPYTWLEQYTPKEKWLGGYYENGEPKRTYERLQSILAPEFDELESLNLPFLIREHARKSQYSVAHATIWRKRQTPLRGL